VFALRSPTLPPYYRYGGKAGFHSFSVSMDSQHTNGKPSCARHTQGLPRGHFPSRLAFGNTRTSPQEQATIVSPLRNRCERVTNSCFVVDRFEAWSLCFRVKGHPFYWKDSWSK